ncbi:hypothetical protein L211DRAFT_644209 [Terfezia boudieri ATCC MYA-4762]|uniref:Transmembrane protein n=1 Tax=Terfezia boudieri ATCC MYA-4762 TaxID=1051890 RepID=A0A3N4LZT1_9PEZI|nr:hypothetical protein L211DRAFT_644209 [Terfezia boudieri ATCC MYA-4762]
MLFQASISIMRIVLPIYLVFLLFVTMVSTAPTKGPETPSKVPSSSPSTGSIEVTSTPGATKPMENQPAAPMAGLTTPQLEGMIAGGLVAFTLAVSLLTFCLLRRRRAVTAEKKDIESEVKRTKGLEFFALNLGASNNPWNFSPVDTVRTPQFPSVKGKNQGPVTTPTLPAFKTELDVSWGVPGFGTERTNVMGAPIVPASTLTRVVDSPASLKAATHRKSSISQAVRKMSATFASIVTSSPNAEHAGSKDHSETNGTFGARNTPSPWEWGNSMDVREPVTPLDYPGSNRWDMVIDPLSKEIEVDELVGIAMTERERPSLPGVVTNGIPPPPNPPPTSALPVPPKPLATAISSKPTVRARKRPLPTMTIPVPSATATATANLATFTLLHQSLCRASTIYTEAEGCSPTTTSPASSTRYTYCEGMSPTSPASHFCGTNHSSCIWSCSSSGGTPRSSRHTLSLYSVPSTPHRSSRGLSSSHSLSGYLTASASEAPPLPTSIPMNLNKGRGVRPGPLNLSQKKKKPQRDHLAGELAELPPSPRRLPEEIERVTREMRERQQDEVLRRLFGDVPATAGPVPYGGIGVVGIPTGSRARSGSVATSSSRKGSDSAGFGVYGGNWPERI